jgi:hypothetical protein
MVVDVSDDDPVVAGGMIGDDLTFELGLILQGGTGLRRPQRSASGRTRSGGGAASGITLGDATQEVRAWS